ncbi:MAG: nitrogen regulation protein NR(II) [Vicinamibacteria bacterium]
MASLPSRSPQEDIPSLGIAVLDAIPINVYVVDRRMRVVAWNRHREQGPLGRPRREALGRHLRDILSRQGYRAAEPILKGVFESGAPHEETTESRDRMRLFHARRLPVFRGRTVTHVVSWFEDITDRRAMEMRLIATDRLAYLGQLVAGVAHEVSNPLAGIAGCAEALASLAMSGGNDAAAREAREFRDLIRGELARCERLVRSLLDSARRDPSSTSDLRAVVGTALRLLERHPAFARVRVVSRIPEGLPLARIDADSLKQVVMALALNAARAMPDGGTLSLRATRGRDAVVLDVLDTGPGVPASLRSRIFEPFFTTRSEEGTGLGLAIARSLVRGRGGDIICGARRGRGALFRVSLQFAEAAR